MALVHTNTSVTLGGAAAARVAGVPHVWHVREIYAGFERWWPAYRRLLLTADALPCVSAATAEQFDGAPGAQVLHDGLAVEARRADARRHAPRSGSTEDAFVVAVLGRVSGWKGQDVLVRALGESALRARPEVDRASWPATPGGARSATCAPCTSSPPRSASRRASATSGSATTSPTSTARPMSSRCRRSSPTPCPTPRSRRRRPAAASWPRTTAGCPEILADGITGRLVTPGDPAALATVLAELAGDPAQRERLGAAAAEDVTRRFSTQRLLAEVQALYDGLLG